MSAPWIAARRCASVRSRQRSAQRARQFNLEFRVADATASPYLALAMLVQAGLDGIRRQQGDRCASPRRCPTSLAEALTLLEAAKVAATGWERVLSGLCAVQARGDQGLETG
jgi:glutamine synthetase